MKSRCVLLVLLCVDTILYECAFERELMKSLFIFLEEILRKATNKFFLMNKYNSSHKKLRDDVFRSVFLTKIENKQIKLQKLLFWV